jgi:hypothetical protein
VLRFVEPHRRGICAPVTVPSESAIAGSWVAPALPFRSHTSKGIWSTRDRPLEGCLRDEPKRSSQRTLASGFRRSATSPASLSDLIQRPVSEERRM